MQACSSVAEHWLYTAAGRGSRPAASTASHRRPRRSAAARLAAVAALLLAPVALAGCGATPSPPPPAANTGAATAEYVIGAGDHLGIFVYDSPQLSVADLPVRPDGRISMPLVPEVTASGRTPTELSKILAEKLKQYVREPNVTVMVREFVGPLDRQVKVIGEAAEPLAIPYRDHMTVLDVMIQTKGLTRFAAGNSAVGCPT